MDGNGAAPGSQLQDLTELWADATENYRHAMKAGRTFLAAYWYAGEALAAVRAATPHGRWGKELELRGIARTTAYRMIQVFKCSTVEQLEGAEDGTVTGLLSPPKPKPADLVEHVQGDDSDATIAARTGAPEAVVRRTRQRVHQGHGSALASGETTLRDLDRSEAVRPMTPIEKRDQKIADLHLRIEALTEVGDRAVEIDRLTQENIRLRRQRDELAAELQKIEHDRARRREAAQRRRDAEDAPLRAKADRLGISTTHPRWRDQVAEAMTREASIG